MQANQILTADLLDILFDGKNKDYGAYQLRKTYDRRMYLSMLITLLVVAVPAIIYFLPGNKGFEMPVTQVSPPIELIPDIIIEKRIDPPPTSSKKSKAVKTVMSTIPVIVADHDMQEINRVPDQTDLDNVKIGAINQDGDPDLVVAPSGNSLSEGSGNGTGEGATEANNSNGELSRFRAIEIESEYPGSQKAWARFLNRTLGNAYPSDAFEKGIQGTVLIQFVVDIDGTVSNIEALSGPEELREAAINTIKKSGKWIPAIQNGRKVKTYKRQPITFVLQGEE
jgi:protein TonB